MRCLNIHITHYLFHLLVYTTVLLSSVVVYSQKLVVSVVVPNDLSVTGHIRNYSNQYLYLYQCYGDTLLFIDSVKTDAQGKFTISNSLPFEEGWGGVGLYRFNLPNNQWFYILNDAEPVEIKTIYQPSAFYNIATDSLKVIKSEENKRLYEFQRLQQQLNIANYWLLQMMRLYPLSDPFHKQLEDEYFSRHKAMDRMVKKLHATSPYSLSTKIALAYYQPVTPDWKQPDTWRDSIIAQHYFDYFNPSDSFYLHTNILPEKMEIYLKLKTNKQDAYGQPMRDENFVTTAVQEFLNKVKSNKANFDFCLNYLLKRLDKEKQFTAMLETYDNYVKTGASDCESTNKQLDWIRKKVSVLRNIQIGSIAPNFDIEEGIRSLHQLQSDYTLLFFWASWCGHCTQTLPKIKKVTDEFNSEKSGLRSAQLITVAVSLDYDSKEWQKYIQDNSLTTWLNTSELKGWNGTVPKQYNVYATPTMFLLDKNKKIIAKPEDTEQLTEALKKNN